MQSVGFHGFGYDETKRRAWQNPETILQEIGLRSGSVFMDMGCGDGFFSIPAARTVGSEGRVYAVDVDEGSVKRIMQRASREGLLNVILRIGKAEDTVFCANYVFFGNVLHDFEEPAKVLANARTMLKPRGRLIDLDWKKKLMPIGAPYWKRFEEEKATALIANADFRIERVRDSGPYHYMIIAERP